MIRSNSAPVPVPFLTAFLALAVLMPLLGHATYHSYRDTIDARDWRAPTDP